MKALLKILVWDLHRIVKDLHGLLQIDLAWNQARSIESGPKIEAHWQSSMFMTFERQSEAGVRSQNFQTIYKRKGLKCV